MTNKVSLFNFFMFSLFAIYTGQDTTNTSIFKEVAILACILIAMHQLYCWLEDVLEEY